MDAQTAIDLVVLGLPDIVALNLIDTHFFYLTDTKNEHSQELIDMLIKSIDNTYGDGSYAKFCATGTLPSLQ